jgi:hypothetical protein
MDPNKSQTVAKSRKIARIGNARFYRAHKPCKHGHEPIRYADSGSCVACVKDHARAARLELPTTPVEPTKFFKATKPCKRGHVPLRYESTGQCVQCCRERTAGTLLPLPRLEKRVRKDQIRPYDSRPINTRPRAALDLSTNLVRQST